MVKTAVKFDPELKPCPFCGRENLEITNGKHPLFTITCLDCGCNVSGRLIESPHDRDTRFHFTHGVETRSVFEATYDQLWPEFKEACDSAIALWNTRS